MRMKQLAKSQPIAICIQNLPTVRIMIPPGIGMQQRHFKTPGHAILLRGHIHDFGRLSHSYRC